MNIFYIFWSATVQFTVELYISLMIRKFQMTSTGCDLLCVVLIFMCLCFCMSSEEGVLIRPEEHTFVEEGQT